MEPRDPKGAKIGMWLFLSTELLLFGGLFLLYAVFRAKHTEDFQFAAQTLDTPLGTINTGVLLTSSLVMALGVHALKNNREKLSRLFIMSTVVLGAVFLVVKLIEWSHKFHQNLYPNSSELILRPPGENIFYGLYFTMTGLHGLHVVIGLVLLLVVWVQVGKMKAQNEDYQTGVSIRLENSGLYWHLVDVIWIYLFPLFYLIS